MLEVYEIMHRIEKVNREQFISFSQNTWASNEVDLWQIKRNISLLNE